MKSKLLALGIGALLILSTGAAYAQDAQWFHVRVNETDGAKVAVNLPISLLEVALEVIGNEAFKHHGKEMHFGRHGGMDLADVRKMWAELRETGDAEYVNVEDGDETVRIFRQGDRVIINVDQGEDEKVRVEVPFSVVDILLEGEGNELNFAGALRELARTNDGEIIRVHDGDTDVRVWIDSSNQD